MSHFETMAARLEAHGYATEAARVRALGRFRHDPKQPSPMHGALIPEASREEILAMDYAAKMTSLLTPMCTVNGALSVATAIFASAFMLRHFELIAASSTMADGAPLPQPQIDEWKAQAAVYAERMAELVQIMAGDPDAPKLIVER